MNKNARNSLITRKTFLTKTLTIIFSIIVFFGVVSFLVYPVITMSVVNRTLSCSYEPHTHTESCYDIDGDLICGKSEKYFHTHQKSCYDNDDVLVCNLIEAKQHIHTDECYHTFTILSCDKVDDIRHEHSQDCYKENVDLICGIDDDHVHDESCQNEKGEFVCHREQIETHEHNENCYSFRATPSARTVLRVMLRQSPSHSDEIDMLEEGMITGVTVSYKINGSGNWIEIDNVVQGDDGSPIYSILTQMTKDDLIRFTLSYHVPANALENKNKIGYDLPGAIKISSNLSGDILNDSHQIIGTYIITQNNETTNDPAHITLEFNDQTTSLNRQGSIVTGSVNIDSMVEMLQKGDDGKVDIEFSDNVDIGFEINDDHVKRGDIQLSKTLSKQNRLTGEFEYTINVSTIEGTFNNPIKVHDKMTNVFYDSQIDNFTVKDKNGNTVTNYYFYTPNGSGETNVSQTMPQNAAEFWLSLPPLAPGETYEIKYNAKMPNPDVFDRTNVSNAVDASTIASNGEQISKSVPGSQTQITVATARIVKSGTYNQQNNTISYQIDLNEYGKDLSGFTITDIYNNESTPITNATITPSVGGQSTINLPFTFPQGSTAHYFINYTLPATPQMGTQNANNYVKVGKNGTNFNSNTVTIKGVTPTSYLPLSKMPMGIDDNGDGTLKLKWKIVLNVSQDSLRPNSDGTWWLYDGSADINHNKMWYTRQQIFSTKQAFINALASAGLSNNFSMKIWRYGGGSVTIGKNDTTIPVNDQRFHGFTFYVSGPVPKNSVIEYQYEMTATKPQDNTEPINFENEADLSASSNSVTVHASQTYAAVKPKITKLETDTGNTPYSNDSGAGALHSTTYNHKLLTGNERLVRWMVKVNIPEGYETGRDLVLKETFPKGLNLVDIASVSRCYDSCGAGHGGAIKNYNQMSKGHQNPGDKMVSITSATGQKQTVTFTTVVNQTDDGRNVYEITIPSALVSTIASWPNKGNGQNDGMVADNVDVGNLYNKRIIYFYIYANIPEGDEENKWELIDSFHRRGEFLNEVKLFDVFASDDNTELVSVGTSNHTVRRTTEFDKNLISKGHEPITNNIVPYNITINPDAKALTDLGETVQIIDEVKVYDRDNISLELIDGRVSIYTDRNKTTLLDASKFQMTFQTENVADNTGRYKIYRINLTVPDRQTLYLSYSYFINGSVNQVCSFKNTVKIIGYSTNENWKSEVSGFHVQEASATGEVHQIFFRKVDASNYQLTLPNAKFEVYSVDPTDTLGDISSYQRVVNQTVTTQGPEKYVFTSDENGICALTIVKDHAYCIVETESPPGYIRDPKPHYFYIYGDNGEVTNLPQNVLAPDRSTDDQIASTDLNAGQVEEGYDIFEVERFDEQTNSFKFLNNAAEFNSLNVGDKVKIRFSFNIPGRTLSLNEQNPLQNATNAAVCYVGRNNVTSYPYIIDLTHNKTTPIVIQGNESQIVGSCNVSAVTENGNIYAKIVSTFTNDVVKANMAGEDIPGSVYCEATIQKNANGQNYVDFDDSSVWTCKTTKVNHPFHFYSVNDNIHFDNIGKLKISKTWYKSINPAEYLTSQEIPYEKIKIDIYAEISSDIVDTYDIVHDANGNLQTKCLPFDIDQTNPGENKSYRQKIATVELTNNDAVNGEEYKWETNFNSSNYLPTVSNLFQIVNGSQPDGLMQYGIIKTQNPSKLKWNDKIVVVKYTFEETYDDCDHIDGKNNIGDVIIDSNLNNLYKRVYGRVEVRNLIGYVLPQTGGYGTASFFISGITIIFLTIAGFIVIKRKKKR